MGQLPEHCNPRRILQDCGNRLCTKEVLAKNRLTRAEVDFFDRLKKRILKQIAVSSEVAALFIRKVLILEEVDDFWRIIETD